MEYNKHLPAFPSVVHYENGRPIGFQCGELSSQEIGISKLEFFACNAPVDIPDWYKHTPIKWEEVLPPQITNIANEDLKKQAKAWIHDPIYDLPQELDWFQDEYEKYWDSKRRFEIADEQSRYFQWRNFYAEQLLLTLSTPQP